MEFTALPISDKAKELVATSIANYKRYARLNLSVDTIVGRTLWITAHQYEAAPGGKVLTDTEIMDRATEVFGPLQEEGFAPIICVYTVSDGDPSKPVTKHRSGSHIHIDGKVGSVLRIAPPRVLFHTANGEQFFLINEDPAAGAKFEQLAHKAKAWVERAPFREHARAAKEDVAQLERVAEDSQDYIYQQIEALRPHLEKAGLDAKDYDALKDADRITHTNALGLNGEYYKTFSIDGTVVCRLHIDARRVIDVEAAPFKRLVEALR